jgi:hypothetical protein
MLQQVLAKLQVHTRNQVQAPLHTRCCICILPQKTRPKRLAQELGFLQSRGLGGRCEPGAQPPTYPNRYVSGCSYTYDTNEADSQGATTRTQAPDNQAHACCSRDWTWFKDTTETQTLLESTHPLPQGVKAQGSMQHVTPSQGVETRPSTHPSYMPTRALRRGGTDTQGAKRSGETWAYVKEYECVASHASVKIRTMCTCMCARAKHLTTCCIDRCTPSLASCLVF